MWDVTECSWRAEGTAWPGPPEVRQPGLSSSCSAVAALSTEVNGRREPEEKGEKRLTSGGETCHGSADSANSIATRAVVETGQRALGATNAPEVAIATAGAPIPRSYPDARPATSKPSSAVAWRLN